MSRWVSGFQLGLCEVNIVKIVDVVKCFGGFIQVEFVEVISFLIVMVFVIVKELLLLGFVEIWLMLWSG